MTPTDKLQRLLDAIGEGETIAIEKGDEKYIPRHYKIVRIATTPILAFTTSIPHKTLATQFARPHVRSGLLGALDEAILAVLPTKVKQGQVFTDESGKKYKVIELED